MTTASIVPTSECDVKTLGKNSNVIKKKGRIILDNLARYKLQDREN